MIPGLNFLHRKEERIDSIPPGKVALVEHTARAIFQGGCVWGKEPLTVSPQLPSPANLGWTRGSSNKWELVWPEVSSFCEELIRCEC